MIIYLYRLLQLHWCCASFIIAYLQPAIRDTNLLEDTVHSVHFKNITQNSQNQGFWKFWSIAAERLVCCCV